MTCRSCGNTHQENFCPNCGEKKFHSGQLSVKHFIEETFEGFVHFDSKFFYTLKTLVTKPGQLSVDFAEGRRIKSMRPVQFFLVVNLLFFFLIFGGNMYSLSLNNYVSYRPFTNYNTKQIVAKKLKEENVKYEEYRQLFDEKMRSESKEYIFVLIPFYGFLFFIFFFWKKMYFTTHLSFAAHFISFVLLFTLLSHYLVTVPFYLFANTDYSPNFDNIFSIFFSVVLTVYVAFAIKRFYNPHIIVRLLVSLFVGVTFLQFIQFYRMLLFFKIVNF